MGQVAVIPTSLNTILCLRTIAEAIDAATRFRPVFNYGTGTWDITINSGPGLGERVARHEKFGDAINHTLYCESLARARAALDTMHRLASDEC